MAETELSEKSQAHGAGRAHPGTKEYVRIGVILAVITAAEVATYYVQKDLGAWLRPILFSLSGLKFTLVVLWFMHLRFDSRLYSRFFLIGVCGAVTLYLIVLMTFRVFAR
ncbi:MAG: cytochrome C oxidase subunit IV family protein [Actinobacteria bacterium]|nr:cytochrome C oxidase subunit IV family protein [Actinomycetota bacterium]